MRVRSLKCSQGLQDDRVVVLTGMFRGLTRNAILRVLRFSTHVCLCLLLISRVTRLLRVSERKKGLLVLLTSKGRNRRHSERGEAFAITMQQASTTSSSLKSETTEAGTRPGLEKEDE